MLLVQALFDILTAYEEAALDYRRKIKMRWYLHPTGKDIDTLIGLCEKLKQKIKECDKNNLYPYDKHIASIRTDLNADLGIWKDYFNVNSLSCIRECLLQTTNLARIDSAIGCLKDIRERLDEFIKAEAYYPRDPDGPIYLSPCDWRQPNWETPEDRSRVYQSKEQMAKGTDANLASTKSAETEQKDTPTTIININKLGVLGDIQQVETLQTGDNAFTHRHVGDEEKKKGILRRIPYWIYLLVSFLAALLAIFHHMGWLAPNK